MKVCDYGLSAIINPCKVYFRREEKSVDLPVKWMSPESLQDGVFSEKADVVNLMGGTFSQSYIYTCFLREKDTI